MFKGMVESIARSITTAHRLPKHSVVNGGAQEAYTSSASEYSPILNPLANMTEYDAQLVDRKIELISHRRDSILQMLEGKTVPMTVLSIDIANSSMNIMKLSNEQVGRYYEAFLERTSVLVQAYGGCVLKYVGDCVIGLFPKSIHGTHMAGKATLCGLAAFKMIKKSLNPFLADGGLPSIECRVSADYGLTKAVRVGSNPDSLIDVFGKPMNSVTKILHSAKPGEMVIGDDLFWELEASDDIFEVTLVNRWDPFGKNTYPVYVVRPKVS